MTAYSESVAAWSVSGTLLMALWTTSTLSFLSSGATRSIWSDRTRLPTTATFFLAKTPSCAKAAISLGIRSLSEMTLLNHGALAVAA